VTRVREILTPAKRQELEEILFSRLSPIDMEQLVAGTGRSLQRIVIPNGLTMGEVVFKVVDAAIQQDWIVSLVEAAVRKIGGIELKTIWRDLQAQRTASMLDELRQDLVRTLGEHEVDPDLVLEAYAIVKSDLFLPSVANIIEAVYHLSDTITSTDGRVPFLEFAAHLEHATEGEKRTELRAWLTMASDTGVFGAVNLAAVYSSARHAAERFHKSDLHVLISIHPEPSGKYIMKSWWQLVRPAVRGLDRFDHAVQIQGQQECAEEELRLKIHEARTQALEAYRSKVKNPADRRRTVVEVFQPLGMMGNAADQWHGSTTDKLSLGCKHWFVLRSWERTYQPQLEVREKWQKLWASHLAGGSGSKFAEDKFKEAQYDATVELDGDITAVALTFIPSAGIVDTVMASGMPVALWPRITPNSSYSKFLGELIRQPLPEWRDEVRNARLLAVRKNSAKHYGNHLTLVWDDHDRLPPDDPYSEQLSDPEGP